ncbi:MAG TPA: hypothetical protein P5136_00785 [Methanofastidiosum sp.]|nr:hypothetical protein [Methanofastidiosum sp.]
MKGWEGKDCPICGAKDSMKHRTGLREEFISNEFPSFVVENLDGDFCEICDEGFYSQESLEKIGFKFREVKQGMVTQ